jgi:uncharacterized membrane protein
LKVFDYAKEQLNFWFEEQFKKGMQKYGVPLHTFNGRIAFDDLLQELVDAVMYANQMRLEMIRASDIIINGGTPTEEEMETFKKYVGEELDE